MRKIKECICDSTEKVSMEIGNPIFPMCLTYFLTNMASILLVDADQRLMQDVPTMTMGKDKFEGQAKEKPTIFDVLSIWNGNDMMRHMGQNMQLQGFLDWFMEQNEPEEDMWFNMDFLVEKWNQYVCKEAIK